MKTVYEPPKSSLDNTIRQQKMPLSAISLIAIFVIEGIFAVLINVFGLYEYPPTDIYSIEMVGLLLSSALIWLMLIFCVKARIKYISVLIWIFIGINVVFSSPDWVKKGIFVGYGEVLSFANFLLLIAAMFLVKVPLKSWFGS